MKSKTYTDYNDWNINIKFFDLIAIPWRPEFYVAVSSDGLKYGDSDTISNVGILFNSASHYIASKKANFFFEEE